jgi:hypothetical protein
LPTSNYRLHNRSLLLPPRVSMQTTIGPIAGCCLHWLPVKVLWLLPDFRALQLRHLLTWVFLRLYRWKM